MSEPGTMEGAVNVHVLDHLVNGPAAHRDLMDAAREQDATLAAKGERLAELEADYEEMAVRMKAQIAELAAALTDLLAYSNRRANERKWNKDHSHVCSWCQICVDQVHDAARAALAPKEEQR